MKEITPEELLAQYEDGGVADVATQDPEGGKND